MMAGRSRGRQHEPRKQAAAVRLAQLERPVIERCKFADDRQAEARARLRLVEAATATTGW
jgi:hypothetical protein